MPEPNCVHIPAVDTNEEGKKGWWFKYEYMPAADTMEKEKKKERKIGGSNINICQQQIQWRKKDRIGGSNVNIFQMKERLVVKI